MSEEMNIESIDGKPLEGQSAKAARKNPNPSGHGSQGQSRQEPQRRAQKTARRSRSCADTGTSSVSKIVFRQTLR